MPLREMQHSGFTVACILALLVGCEVSSYSGDGLLRDRGPLVATDRYVLDLGDIDLGKNQTLEYRIVGLPPRRFVVGLEIDCTDRELVSATHHVAMTLNAQSGETLFTFDAAMGDWTWNVAQGDPTAFVYGRTVDDSLGRMTNEIIFSQSTYFEPAPTEEYRLLVSIVGAMETEMITARLKARSGGWK